MRALKYKMADGTIVNTLSKGEVVLEEIAGIRPKMTPVRDLMMKKFGYVSPKLKDKVML